MNDLDQQFLQVALEQAALGMYSTTPNPRVGCVIVRDGEVLGRGYHVRRGEAHAEVNALKNVAELGNDARGACAYVSLEPCNFIGATGACSEALIKAGITRVVCALTDPHPQVSGTGFAKLRDAGIEVVTTELPEAADLIAGYLSRVTRGRPFIRLKAAMSLDGRTAMASGESQWITGEAARRDVQQWRARSCAIITGRGTVQHDDPALTVRDEAYAVEGHIRQPLRVVLDGGLKTHPSAKVYAPAENALLVYGSNASVREAEMMRFNHVPRLQSGTVQADLNQVLSELAAHDCNEVLVEAGAGLLGSFMGQGLWDELVLYIAPRILGSAGRPLFEMGLTHMAQAIDATIVETTHFGDDMRLRLRPKD